MVSRANNHWRSTVSSVVHFLIWTTLLAVQAYAQGGPNRSGKRTYAVDPADLIKSISRLKSGHFLLIDIENVANAQAVENIPILREQFALSLDPLVKGKIASALVRMGDKDDTYWEFLLELVTPAVESSAPNFMSYDSRGKSMPGPSPEFVTWAKAHKESSNAGQDAVYLLPSKVMLLGEAHDPRAIPLLRRALLSANHQIEVAAAMGLAEIQDKDSIPPIIEACKRVPAEVASVVAQSSLVYFDDPQAQNAVDIFVPKESAKALREAKANGKKPFN